MPEAVIVATARTPIGRANKGSLVDVPPRRPRRARSSEAVLDKVPALDPQPVEDVIWGCGQPGRRGRLQRRPRRRAPRRAARRARRHRQPLLLVVAADDPHGRPRDQGRRGRRVRRRRRRDRQPLPVRRGRHRPAQPEVRRGARRAPRSAPRAAQPPWTPPAGPARRLHRDGPDRGERAPRPRSVSREEMDEFAARSQQRAVDVAGERLLRAGDHAGHARPTARS